MKKRQLSPLPLPRSWLTHAADGFAMSDREMVLAGKRMKPGTQAHLRAALLSAGWEPDIVEPVLSGKLVPRSHLVDLAQEHRQDIDINAALLRLKANGYKAELVANSGGSSTYVKEVWDSFTRFPWWTSALRGKRQLMLVGKTPNAVKRATAGFMRDLWINLGEAPEQRLPGVRRVNMLGFASSDGIAAFRQVAENTGVIVAHGLDTADFIYQMFSYAAALAQVAPHAVLVYEAVPAPDVSEETLLSAAQRANFPFVFGIGVRRG